MTNPDKLFGRLGNRMFQMAALYSIAKDNNEDWYFQDLKYFNKYESDIKALFGEGIGFLEQVSIHVRRGDYVGNSFYSDLCETDYYEKAVKLFPDRQFLVFSDDPEFCQTIELFRDLDRFQIMDKTNDIEDFNLQASCADHIIANSSWSWWTAFLSPNHSKKVVAPKSWYSDGVERTKCPKEWIRI